MGGQSEVFGFEPSKVIFYMIIYYFLMVGGQKIPFFIQSKLLSKQIFCHYSLIIPCALYLIFSARIKTTLSKPEFIFQFCLFSILRPAQFTFYIILHSGWLLFLVKIFAAFTIEIFNKPSYIRYYSTNMLSSSS